MNRALFAGLSSTVAQQVRMDVAANNLANVNTVGFKAGRTTFMDAFYQALRGGRPSVQSLGGVSPMQVGAGVSVGSISMITTQGALQRTGQPLDAALDGEGLFVVKGPTGLFYTRDGAFELDEKYTLVMASSGLKVQGWQATETDGVVRPVGGLGDLSFPLGTMRAAQATTRVTMQGNLPAGALPDPPADPPTITSSVDVYDAMGGIHQLTLTFTKTDATTWSVTAELNGTTTGPETVTFNDNGTYASISNPLVVASGPLPNGAAELAVTVDLSNLTQFTSGSDPTAREQDGHGPAALVAVAITDGGVVQGSYSDGRSAALALLAVAAFPNVGGLDRAGNNLFRVGANSGLPQIGQAGEGGRGQVVGRALEMANTDLTGAFLEMLITQRAYQAGARVISTANHLLEEAIQLANR